MAKQSEGKYHLAGFEITIAEHRHLKLAAALDDKPIKEYIRGLVFDEKEMASIARRARVIADLHADIEADTSEPQSPKTGKESAAYAEPQPDKIVATPPPQSPKRTKAERMAGRPNRTHSTPVTDSLTDEERERIAAACSPTSYTMEGDGGWDPEPDSNRKKRLTDELLDDDEDDFVDEDEDELEDEDGDPAEIDFND